MHPQTAGCFLPGTIVNDAYEIESLLGMGSSGIVYLCRHRELDRYPVALKVFFPSRPEYEVLATQFRHEVWAAYRVNHPHVIRCFEFIQEADFMAFTMEYVGGGNLSQVIGKGPLEVEHALSILIAMISGLQAIHDAGIVHRDLKPENVLLTTEGNIKISDFGVARSADTVSPGSKGIIGTVGYISPEYLSTGKCDLRSDIFAAGIIAYEMLTGKNPFQGKTPLHTLCLRAEKDATPLNLVRNDCPLFLGRIVAKALARNPEQRYQNAGEMLADLRSLAARLRSEHFLQVDSNVEKPKPAVDTRPLPKQDVRPFPTSRKRWSQGPMRNAYRPHIQAPTVILADTYRNIASTLLISSALFGTSLGIWIYAAFEIFK